MENVLNRFSSVMAKLIVMMQVMKCFAHVKTEWALLDTVMDMPIVLTEKMKSIVLVSKNWIVAMN